jgi:hypothetical protein
MDYETFGEHQWAETGIFRFFEGIPAAILKEPRFRFRTPSEVAAEHDPIARLVLPRPVSWADAERDVSAWLGNPMQRSANEALYAIRPDVVELAESGDAVLYDRWRRLSTSDHLYYMCTKHFSDGEVHKYFSPYASPHDAFIAFMNVLDDLARRVKQERTSDMAQPARLRAPEPSREDEDSAVRAESPALGHGPAARDRGNSAREPSGRARASDQPARERDSSARDGDSADSDSADSDTTDSDTTDSERDTTASDRETTARQRETTTRERDPSAPRRDPSARERNTPEITP